MPNNVREDYVAPHRHSVEDMTQIGGASQLVVAAIPTTSGPTTTSIVPETIPEMDITVNVPSTYPLWQATVAFDATVQHDTQDGIVIVRILLDTTDVSIVRDVGASFADTPYSIGFSRTTVVSPGSRRFRAQWSTDTGEASSPALARGMSVKLTPYVPQVL